MWAPSERFSVRLSLNGHMFGCFCIYHHSCVFCSNFFFIFFTHVWSNSYIHNYFFEDRLVCVTSVYSWLGSFFLSDIVICYFFKHTYQTKFSMLKIFLLLMEILGITLTYRIVWKLDRNTMLFLIHLTISPKSIYFSSSGLRNRISVLRTIL